MKIAVNITIKRVVELIESNCSAYWAKKFRWKGRPGFQIVEHDDGPEKLHIVTPAKLQRGLELMAKAGPDEGGHHFANMLTDSTDAWTGDALIQFAVFGELKYG